MEEKIKNFCEKWKISKLSLFGSYLTPDFNKDSDVDVLIEFNDNAKYGFFEMVEMKAELEKIFGRKVDLITRKGLNYSRNYLRTKSILSNTKVMYGE